MKRNISYLLGLGLVLVMVGCSSVTEPQLSDISGGSVNSGTQQQQEITRPKPHGKPEIRFPEE